MNRGEEIGDPRDGQMKCDTWTGYSIPLIVLAPELSSLCSLICGKRQDTSPSIIDGKGGSVI
jgi:hypothetical protein